jgi:hypothetical protein
VFLIIIEMSLFLHISHGRLKSTSFVKMVRIINRSQSANRREWLQDLERQKMELEEKRRREKDLMRNNSDMTLSEPNYKEFGGRRRPFNNIIKLEQESLPKIPDYFLQDQVEDKRIPFSGAVKLKEPSFHRTKSCINSNDNHLNLEYKLALEKQIREKKERIEREKKAERQLELREIARVTLLEKQELNESYNFSRKFKESPKISHQVNNKYESKIPKLKHFTSTNQRIEDILPVISKFTDLIGRTSQLSFTSSHKRSNLTVKNPPPVLIKEKQVVRKPVKIVQKFPVRTTELTTPPSLGKKTWPAGTRSIPLPRTERKLQDSHIKACKSFSDSHSQQEVVIPFKNLAESREESGLNLDESLERRIAIQELQALWSEYEHDKKTD